MKAKNSLTNRDSLSASGNIHVGDQITVHVVKNSKRGIRHYECFDNYVLRHMGAAVAG
jgi:hypothetical protein